jgi:hypothetical protein
MVIKFDHNLGMTGNASAKVTLRIFSSLGDLNVNVIPEIY